MPFTYKLSIVSVFVALGLPLVANAEISELKTVLAVEQEVTDYHQLDAQIEAVNKSTVSAQTGGLISKLSYDVGDYVKKGSLIARISSQDQKSGVLEAKAGVNQAKASISGASAGMNTAKASISRATAAMAQTQAIIREAQANYAVARSEFGRVKGLYQKRILSKSQYDQAEANMRSTLARVESAKARQQSAQAERVAAESILASAKANLTSAKASLSSSKASLSKAGQQLGYTEVIAPYSGIVTERHVELGEVVSTGSAIMTGISLKEMRAVAHVPQRLILNVRKHNSARIYINDDKIGLAAKGITFFPYADALTNAFKVRLSFDSAPEGLFPGVFVKVGFEVGKEKQLVVPTAAIAYRSEVTGLYVISEKGVPSLRQVRLGKLTNNGNIRILAGLDAGEKIAIDPVHAVLYLKQLNAKGVEAEGNNHD